MGGLTKARAIRDLAVSAGIPMNIEDTWGGDIVTAAIAHLAHSTPDDYLFCRFVDWLPDASFYVLLLYMVLMSIRMLLLRCYSPPLCPCISTDFNSYGPVSIADTTAHRIQGRLAAPIAPGLGVTVKHDVLKAPVFMHPNK